MLHTYLVYYFLLNLFTIFSIRETYTGIFFLNTVTNLHVTIEHIKIIFPSIRERKRSRYYNFNVAFHLFNLHNKDVIETVALKICQREFTTSFEKNN